MFVGSVFSSCFAFFLFLSEYCLPLYTVERSLKYLLAPLLITAPNLGCSCALLIHFSIFICHLYHTKCYLTGYSNHLKAFRWRSTSGKKIISDLAKPEGLCPGLFLASLAVPFFQQIPSCSGLSHTQVHRIQMKLTSFKSSGTWKKQIWMYSSGIVTVSAAKTHLLYVCLEYVCCWL